MMDLRKLRQDLDEVRAQAERDRIGTYAQYDRLRGAYSVLEDLEIKYEEREAKRLKQEQQEQE